MTETVLRIFFFHEMVVLQCQYARECRYFSPGNIVEVRDLVATTAKSVLPT